MSGTRPGAARLHWSIPDPMSRNNDAAFENAYAEIDERVARLAVLGLVQLSLIGGGPVWITARGRVDAAGADGL